MVKQSSEGVKSMEGTYNVRRTYRTLGAALADPTSNVARQLVKATAITRSYRDAADRLQAQGMTGEQAWAQLIARDRRAS